MQMMAECFRAQEQNQLPIGKSADGRSVFLPFCPSVLQLSHLVTPFLDQKATAQDLLPIPKGFVLARCAANGQLQIALGEAYARRFGRVFGYIGSIKLDTRLISHA